MQQVEIRIRGEIAPEWSDWLADLRIASDRGGETVLTGYVPDQAALRGVLDRLADLGLELALVAVTRVMAGCEGAHEARAQARLATIDRIT